MKVGGERGLKGGDHLWHSENLMVLGLDVSYGVVVPYHSLFNADFLYDLIVGQVSNIAHLDDSGLVFAMLSKVGGITSCDETIIPVCDNIARDDLRRIFVGGDNDYHITIGNDEINNFIQVGHNKKSARFAATSHEKICNRNVYSIKVSHRALYSDRILIPRRHLWQRNDCHNHRKCWQRDHRCQPGKRA